MREHLTPITVRDTLGRPYCPSDRHEKRVLKWSQRR